MANNKVDEVGMTYRALTKAERDLMYEVKQKGQEFIDLAKSIGKSDAIDVSVIRAEEAVMWAVKHIARN